MVANHKGKQPEILGEVDLSENCYSDGELLVISDYISKLDEH